MSEEQNKYALLQTVTPPKPQHEMTTWEERQAKKKAEEDAIRNRVRGARTDKPVFIPALPKPKYDDNEVAVLGMSVTEKVRHRILSDTDSLVIGQYHSLTFVC